MNELRPAIPRIDECAGQLERLATGRAAHGHGRGNFGARTSEKHEKDGSARRSTMLTLGCGGQAGHLPTRSLVHEKPSPRGSLMQTFRRDMVDHIRRCLDAPLAPS